jgi:oligoendopeptidase F
MRSITKEKYMNPALLIIFMNAARRRREEAIEKYKQWLIDTRPEVLKIIVEEGPKIRIDAMARNFGTNGRVQNMRDSIDFLEQFGIQVYPDENSARCVVKNFEDLKNEVLKD